MNYPIDWQDILCRFNIWHSYTDWQSDTRTIEKNGELALVQSKFCFNCHWRKVKRIKWPKYIGDLN